MSNNHAVYYVTDRQGTVTALIDTAGDLAAFYRYTPYGKSEIVTDTTGDPGAKSPWRYIGGYQNIEGDGYLKLGARYYDGLGHFTQPDPVSGTVDGPTSNLMYGYAESDPINKDDKMVAAHCPVRRTSLAATALPVRGGCRQILLIHTLSSTIGAGGE